MTTLAACGDVRNVVACPPLADSRQKVLDLAQRLAARFRPQTGAYYEVWIDGDHAVSGAGRSAGRRRAAVRRHVPPGSSRSGWPGRGQLHRHPQPRSRPGARGWSGRRRRLRRPGGWRPGASHARPHDTFLVWPTRSPGAGRRRRGRRRSIVPAFRDLGNREDRKRALKYVIEDSCLDAFRREVEQRFGAARAGGPSCRRGTSTTTWAGTGTTAAGSSVCRCRADGRPAACGRPWPRSSSFELDVRITLAKTCCSPASRRHSGPRLSTSCAATGWRSPTTSRPSAAWPWPARPSPRAGRPWPRRNGWPRRLEGARGRAGRLGRRARSPRAHDRLPQRVFRPYTAEIGIVGRTKTGYDIHLGGAPGGDRPRRPWPAASSWRTCRRARPVAGPLAQERSDGETFGDFVHGAGAVSLVLDDPPAPVALAWPRRRTEAPFATPLDGHGPRGPVAASTVLPPPRSCGGRRPRSASASPADGRRRDRRGLPGDAGVSR